MNEPRYTMDGEIVKQRVEAIRVRGMEQRDSESAHAMEDELYLDLLKAIANNTCHDPEHCARLAIETEKLEFYRWYA